MDFLDIRKKAKERARARAEQEASARADGAAAPAPPAEAAAATPDAGAAPPAPPVVTDEDVIEGALAARLQGLPPAGGEAEPRAIPAALADEGDAGARFTTWRPGVGAPPALPADLPAGALPELHDEDFTVLAPPAAPRGPRAARRRTDGDPARAEVDPLEEFFYHPDEAGPALPQLAAAAASEEAPPESLVREEYLTFLLGAEEYAVAIERVREVLRAPPVTEVPRAPAHILGVVTVRGEVVAVVDPRRRLGLPPLALGEGEGKVVIVDAGEGPCGLLVDRVASVVRLLPGSIEPCPQGIAGARAEFLAGIGRSGDRLFMVLELGALLRRARSRAEGSGRSRRTDAGA